MPSQGIEFGLTRAVAPNQPIALGAEPFGLGHAIAIDDVPVLVLLLMDHSPDHLALGKGFTEHAILGASAGQDAEESPAALMHVGHVLRGGELAVGDVKEVT